MLSSGFALTRCAGGKHDMDSSFQSVSPDSVIKRAMESFYNGDTDSAVMSLSYITESFETQGTSAHKNVTAEQALRAYINLGYIFGNYITDYPKAYDCGRRALEIYNQGEINDTSSTSYLPYIYLNLGVTLLSYEDSRLDTDSLPRDNERYIREAFFVGAQRGEWRPTLIAFQNLCNILLLRGDTTDLRNIVDHYKRLKVPDDVEFLGYSNGISDFSNAYINREFRHAYDIAEEMCTAVDNDPIGENLGYVARWLQAEALDGAGDSVKAEKSLLTLASDIDKSGTDNARMWICKILATRYEGKAPEKCRVWQLAFFKARENMEKSMADTSGIGYLNDLRKVRHSVLEAKESQTRTRHQMVLLIVFSTVTIIILIGIILWQRQSRHYRRTIVKKQLRLIGSDRSVEEENHDAKEGEEPVEELGHDYPVKDELVGKIKDVFSDRKIVLDPEFSMSTLCTLVESNPTYVSRAIKTVYGKSLSALVSEMRIEEACRLLADEQSDRFTVEAVATQVGFKSRSNFTAVFKKNTGLSPAEFKRTSRGI